MKKGFKYNMKNPSKASRSSGKPHIRMSDKKNLGEHPRSWENSRTVTLLMSGLSFILKIVNFKLAIVKRINVTCHMIDVENSKYCGLFEAVSYFRIHLLMNDGKTPAMF